MTSKHTLPPFRTDVVGSYLRPAYLHQARSQFAKGEISADNLQTVENKPLPS